MAAGQHSTYVRTFQLFNLFSNIFKIVGFLFFWFVFKYYRERLASQDVPALKVVRTASGKAIIANQ